MRWSRRPRRSDAPAPSGIELETSQADPPVPTEAEFEPRRGLDEIGLATGTDKASNGHDHLTYYEQIFAPFRDHPLTLIELGVRDGASMRLWEEYFTAARVFGYDFNASSRDASSERVEIIVADQENSERLAQLAKETRPTIIIDDASHRWAHQIATLEAMYPYLKPNGIYIIEDVQTSFGETAATTYGGDGPTTFEYVADLVRGLVASSTEVPVTGDFAGYFRATTRSVTALKHAIVIVKASFEQQIFRRRSLAEIDPDAHLHTPDLPYDRLDASLEGPIALIEEAWRTVMGPSPVVPIPAASAAVRDVTVVGFGLALTSDGSILSETLNCAQNVRRTSNMYRSVEDPDWVNERPLEPIERFQAGHGKRFVLLKQTWDSNYGHWLIDTLPKLALLEELGPIDDCTFVANTQASDAMRAVVLDSLALAGVREEQVLFLPPATYHFEEITILGTISRHSDYKSPRAIRYLERIAASVPSSGTERLYLSRNMYPRRQLVNETELLKVLEAFDYRVVHTEKMSLEEQIATFRSAKYVIGNMGAAMSNLVFAPQGVSVLALATEAMKHDFFYDIVCHKVGRYKGLQGRASTAPPDMSSDFVIDPDLFRTALEWLHRDG